MPLSEILNYFFGGTSLVAIYIAWRSRKSEIKKAEATAMAGMQGVYDEFVVDVNLKFQEMREEIKSLREIVSGYKAKCDKCTNKS